jgi:hypothetical protein
MSRRHRSILGIAVVATALATAAPAGAAPSNDDFANAQPVRVGQTVTGTTVGATGERGEPSHGPGTRQSVWYRLRSSRRVTVLLNSCRAAGDSVIAIYTGRRVGSLNLIDFNDDGCRNLGSRVSFTARPGRTYFIAVAAYDSDDRGRFQLGIQGLNTPPNDDFVDARTLALGGSVAGTTRNATLELGEHTHAAHTVWFRLRSDHAASISLRACFPGFRGRPEIVVYTGRRVGNLNELAYDTCRVTLEAKAGVTYRVQISDGGTGYAFRLTAREASP